MFQFAKREKSPEGPHVLNRSLPVCHKGGLLEAMASLDDFPRKVQGIFQPRVAHMTLVWVALASGKRGQRSQKTHGKFHYF